MYHTDSEKLIGDFIEANGENPHVATANYDLANFYYNDKNYSKASAYFGKADFSSLSDEQQNQGRFRWGYSLFTQKKLKESLDQFNEIKTQGGQYGPAASYYAGFIEYTQGDLVSSMIDLLRAEQNPSYSKIVPYLIASVYYKQKNYIELLKYTKAIKDREGLSNQDMIAHS